MRPSKVRLSAQIQGAVGAPQGAVKEADSREGAIADVENPRRADIGYRLRSVRRPADFRNNANDPHDEADWTCPIKESEESV